MRKSTLFRRKSLDTLLSDPNFDEREFSGLTKALSLRDLISLAIAAIIGAGIFSTIGTAASHGGPAVTLLFVLTAIACSFSALCYAEFASRIPVSGSAYTYAYVTLGEVIAWLIAWGLIMEYSVGNIAVAISWSDYFTSFLSGFGFHLPEYLGMDYLSAKKSFGLVEQALRAGTDVSTISAFQYEGYLAYSRAPQLGGVRIIADFPAFSIVILLTWLVFIGIRETKKAGNIMVVIKLLVILVVVCVGAFYVQPQNWSPFAPNGFGGIMKGVSAVFFAYIGFDAISTTAEECKNTKRDMPRAMIYSLIICTILYVIITLVLTGMVRYNELAVGDPLAYVFEHYNLNWLSGLIGFSAIIALSGAILVFQVGQPRIWMSMGRDGLLPARFGRLHTKYKTPAFATVITGLVVGIPSLFMNLQEVTDLTSIGTLFAFSVVCMGVLRFQKESASSEKGFRVPYLNGKYLIPGVLILLAGYFITFKTADTLGFLFCYDDFAAFKMRLPSLTFIILTFVVAGFTFVRNYSLIPVAGLIINLYLMSEIDYQSWFRFMIWLALGLIIYFGYSIRNSRLANNG